MERREQVTNDIPTELYPLGVVAGKEINCGKNKLTLVQTNSYPIPNNIDMFTSTTQLQLPLALLLALSKLGILGLPILAFQCYPLLLRTRR